MKTRNVALVLALLLPVAAGAVSRAETLRQVESSMLVKGTIETSAGGSVTSVLLDKPEKIPPGVVDFVQKQVMAWKFEPVMVDGTARPARSPMSVRVVARVQEGDSYVISIRNASFHDDNPREGEAITRASIRAPRYPDPVLRSGAQGTVYVVAKVERDGRVSDAVVEQVNLRTIGTRNEMAAWRKALGDATLRAVREWKYTPPVRGEMADDEYWQVRVPVDFKMDNHRYVYGKWEMYIPGARQTLPWSPERERPGFSPDSLAEGGDYLIGQDHGLQLLTPLAGT
ncbi:MAG: energy transducer TonB [Pseudoxanthomonas sp.]